MSIDTAWQRPWTALRLSQTLLVAAVAIFVTLVAFGNLTDSGTNFVFVQHVLAMDTIFPDSRIGYRAITVPWLHHVAYWSIVVIEVVVAVLCWWGVWRLWRRRHASTTEFRQAKGLALLGLTLGCLLWLVGFLAIGSEWFGMWMSPHWNGGPTASRFFLIFLGVMLFLVVRDD